MSRRCPLFAIVVTLAVHGAALGQAECQPIVDRVAGCLIMAPPPRLEPAQRQGYSAWPGVRQVKTGRITIEFQYAHLMRSPQLHWQFMPNDDYDLVPADWSVDEAIATATLWRVDLPVLGDLRTPATFKTMDLGQDLYHLPLLDVDLVGRDVAGTYIRSVDVEPGPGLPLQAGVPGKLRLEFTPRLPPQLEPLNTNGVRQSFTGYEDWPSGGVSGRVTIPFTGPDQ